MSCPTVLVARKQLARRADDSQARIDIHRLANEQQFLAALAIKVPVARVAMRAVSTLLLIEAEGRDGQTLEV